MCGIVAYSGHKPVDKEDFKILLLYSALRGTHATGVGAIKAGVEKANESSPFFIATNEIPNENLVLGHTRNPSTSTPKEEEHAHPFDMENIIGAHNGYFSDHWEIKRELKLEGKFTDSYPILYGIDQHGFKEIAKKISNTSAFALAWLEKSTEKLYLYRSAKPLFWGFKEDGMYVASQREYLEAIYCEAVDSVPYEKLVTVKDGEILESVEVKLKSYNSNWNNNRHTHVRQYTPSEAAAANQKREAKTEKNYPIIDSMNAPDTAKAMQYRGKKHYYWRDGKFAYVEVLKGFKDSTLIEFNMQIDAELDNLAREFTPILNEITKDMKENGI